MLIHKCDNCPFRGEYQAQGFKPFGVCIKERNLIEAEKTYKAERCPYFPYRYTAELDEAPEADFIEMNLLDVIRKDVDLDRLEYVQDLLTAKDALEKAATEDKG